MASKAYLAIDLGAESGRAMVGILAEGQLELIEVHRFRHLARRLPAGLHWDLMRIWGNILEGLRSAVRWASENDLSLASLGVDTWGVDYATIGRSGSLLSLPHCYRDERNAVAYEKTVKTAGSEYLYDQTGIQLLALNTLYQVVAQNDAEPEQLRLADKLLFIPDLFHYFLTGNAVCESTIASTSQMVDARTGDWANELVECLGLPTQMLGEIVPSGTTIGTLLPHIAADTGASEQLKVVAPASHDTASAVAAVPAEASTEWCYVSSGTWSLMGAELSEPCLSEAARQANFTNEGGVDGTIRFLKNLIGLWPVQECRRAFEKQGEEYDYGQLTEMARNAGPFRTLLDMRRAPFASPGRMPEKISEFAQSTGQDIPTEPGQFVRSCLESLAFMYRSTLDELEQVLDRRFDVLHVVGGGGRNELLNQMTANAIGRRVVVGPEEATAAGNVLVQAMGSGDVKDLAELRQIVKTSFQPTTYEPQDTEAWDQAFDRYQEVCGG